MHPFGLPPEGCISPMGAISLGDAEVLDVMIVPTDVTVGDYGDGARPVQGGRQKLADIAVGDVADAKL
jgi:hypothetical protein